MSRYVLTPQAKDDLRDISDFIARSSPETRPLQILRVLHASRDVRHILEGD
jgi:plasmid stabilization system protein ParE